MEVIHRKHANVDLTFMPPVEDVPSQHSRLFTITPRHVAKMPPKVCRTSCQETTVMGDTSRAACTLEPYAMTSDNCYNVAQKYNRIGTSLMLQAKTK